MSNISLKPITSMCMILLAISSGYFGTSHASDVYANTQQPSQLKAFSVTSQSSTDPYLNYLNEIDKEVKSTNAYFQDAAVKKETVSVVAPKKKLDAKEILQRLKSLSTRAKSQ